MEDMGNLGVIFPFDLSGSKYNRLKDFGSNASGSSLGGNLIQAYNKKLYGMTYDGGSNGVGVIFSFDPSTSIYTKLKDFDNNSGRNPLGGLIQPNDGKLYCMTNRGGNNDVGVIFSFEPSTSTYTRLMDFNGANGASPYGWLVQASGGKLYGMTAGGGGNDLGVIFSFDPSYKKLMDLDYTIGASPHGSLIQAADGKLYGMTSDGSSGNVGVIFSYDLSSSTYTDLRDFDFVNDSNPQGSLMQASDGKLYGMTYYGGTFGGNNGLGVIFSFDLSNSTYINLKVFDDTDGARPLGNLMQASDGKLYGMTNQGGSSNLGVIFFLIL